MKSWIRVLSVASLAVLSIWLVANARELGAREAREAIARALGLDNADRVRVKKISTGMGGQAIVEGNVEAVFRLQQDKAGNWNASDIRLDDGRWESFELIETGIRKEKVLRTTADLRTLSTALQAFKREKGFYVVSQSSSALIDNLSPNYIDFVIRVDAWFHELRYSGSATDYRLSSDGPDGINATADDIVIQNGQLVNGG